jgi:hypothetical protein
MSQVLTRAKVIAAQHNNENMASEGGFIFNASRRVGVKRCNIAISHAWAGLLILLNATVSPLTDSTKQPRCTW